MSVGFTIGLACHSIMRTFEGELTGRRRVVSPTAGQSMPQLPKAIASCMLHTLAACKLSLRGASGACLPCLEFRKWTSLKSAF